ncbi:MAG TPA: DUF6790 family protein [bacterium]
MEFIGHSNAQRPVDNYGGSMFLILFVGFLAAGWIHAMKTGPHTKQRFAELMLVYSLVGYFGILMLGVAIYNLVAPERFAASHGWSVSTDNPFQQFVGILYGAMAIIAILAVWLRGMYLLAPAVCWSIFFLGATYIHIADFAARGREITFPLVLHIFSSHGLMAIVVIVLVAAYMPAVHVNRRK